MVLEGRSEDTSKFASMTICFANNLAVMAYLSWRVLKAIIASFNKQCQEEWYDEEWFEEEWFNYGLDDFSSDRHTSLDSNGDYSRDTSAAPSTGFRVMEDFSSDDDDDDLMMT